MKRRDLLKALSLVGVSLTSPAYAKKIYANVSQRELRNARAQVQDISVVKKSTLPTVINVFMYGGPSELAGNLMNINEINSSSLMKYNTVRTDILNDFVANGNTGQITANKFWKNAGGLIMEDMLSNGRTTAGTGAGQSCTNGQMSIFRTINRVQGDTKAHRESIFTSQTGGLATVDAPGMGTVLAAILKMHYPEQFDNADEVPIMPFVTLEGDTVIYDLADMDVPAALRAVSLSGTFSNPYKRARNFFSEMGQTTSPTCTRGGVDVSCDTVLEDLAKATSGKYSARYEKLVTAFGKRANLATLFDTTFSNLAGRMPTADANGVAFTGNANTSFSNNGTPITQGSNAFSNGFGVTLRNAVLLSLVNRDTRMITLSTGGLGGWDDHDNSIARYETRVTGLMSDLRNAVRLLRTGTATSGVLDGNARNDVVINVFGEFGRNANLNGSLGWDHGNNMNLYTFGGSAISGRRLGEAVGATEVFGNGAQNRLFTRPTSGSETWQPYSIAATVYKYFGVQNPQLLTADAQMKPDGYPAIDG